VDQAFHPAGLDKLKLRIQALRAKTISNGCTELNRHLRDAHDRCDLFRNNRSMPLFCPTRQMVFARRAG
jgi:hypothetical protein